jgi:serine/threonine-protein kinase
MGSPRIIDRYALFDEIAAGGMGVVHVGRLAGSQGFARIVAIKRLHPNLAKDPEFVEMFVDEARLAARVRHPNVVITLDVVEGGGEVLVVMDYVHGATLAKVLRLLRERGERIPREIVAAIIHGALQGLARMFSGSIAISSIATRSSDSRSPAPKSSSRER